MSGSSGGSGPGIGSKIAGALGGAGLGIALLGIGVMAALFMAGPAIERYQVIVAGFVTLCVFATAGVLINAKKKEAAHPPAETKKKDTKKEKEEAEGPH